MAKRLIDLDKMVDDFKATKLEECFPDWRDMPPKARAAVIRCSRAWREIILNQPTVDAVEVVRCRDCKHAKELGEVEKKVYLDECLICANGEATIDGYNIVMPEHFCSYGERKEV